MTTFKITHVYEGESVPALVATSTDRRLRGFEWAWDGGEHVHISADVEGWPFGFAVEHVEGVEHTPEAFASFLSELYGDSLKVRLLRRVWAEHPVAPAARSRGGDPRREKGAAPGIAARAQR